MSRRQILVCAARLPDDVALRFMRLLEEADDLGRRAHRLRVEAWALYRRELGLPEQSPPRGRNGKR